MTYPNSHQPWMSGRLWVARQDLSELEWGGTHAADVGMPQAPWPHSAEGPAPASVEHSWHTSPVDTGTYTGKIIIRNTAVWQVYWFHVIQTIKFLHTSSCTYQPHTYIHTPHMDHTIIHKHCRYCKHSWMQPHTHTHKHAHACSHICTYMHTHTLTCRHIGRHTHTNTHIHISYIYTHMQI